MPEKTSNTVLLKPVSYPPASPEAKEHASWGPRIKANRVKSFLSKRGVSISFFACVILPCVAWAIFASAYATPRYTSEFRAMVRTTESMSGIGGIAQLFGVGGVNKGNEATAIVQFLRSREAPSIVMQEFDLRAEFRKGNIDYFSSLGPDNSIEALTRYWNKMSSVEYDKATGTIVVDVTTFDPNTSYRIASILLSASDKLVNEITDQVRSDSLKTASDEVSKAEQRLRDLLNQQQVLQDTVQMLDPQQAATANLTLIASLQQLISTKRAEIAAQRSRMADDAPSIIANQRVLTGLEDELRRISGLNTSLENPQVNALDQGSPISAVLGSFREVEAETRFAEQSYASALSSLEAARMEAARKQVYLATILPPRVPEEASFPRPGYDTLRVFSMALAVWLIGLMSFYAVREHL